MADGRAQFSDGNKVPHIHCTSLPALHSPIPPHCVLKRSQGWWGLAKPEQITAPPSHCPHHPAHCRSTGTNP